MRWYIGLTWIKGRYFDGIISTGYTMGVRYIHGCRTTWYRLMTSVKKTDVEESASDTPVVNNVKSTSENGRMSSELSNCFPTIKTTAVSGTIARPRLIKPDKTIDNTKIFFGT
jgi:hypothetical protein